MKLVEKDVELFWGCLYPLFETLLRLISSKRTIDNANFVNKPPPLRPRQRTLLNLTDKAMKLIEKDTITNKPILRLVEFEVDDENLSNALPVFTT